MALMSVQFGSASAADDWVDDDQVNGFYKKGIIRTRDDYETPPQDMQPGDMEPDQQQQEPDDGANNQSFRPGIPSGFSNPAFNQGAPPNNGQYAQPPQNKAKSSILGKLGKSIVSFPKNASNALMGDDGFFDNPGFWQGAGAVAGMGANSYLNYRVNRNNPYYGGYGSPLIGGGYNPYGGFGYGGMGMPYSPYSPYGSVNPYGGFGGSVGNPYYGSPFGSNPLLPFGTPGRAQFPTLNPAGGAMNPGVPYSPFGGFGNYGGLGGNYGGFGNYGGLGNYGGFGGNYGGFGNRGFGGGIFGGNQHGGGLSRFGGAGPGSTILPFR